MNKKAHHISIGLMALMIAVLIGGSALGVFVIYNHYHVDKTNGLSPDNSKIYEKVTIAKDGHKIVENFYAPYDTGHIKGKVEIVAKHADGTIFLDYISHNTRTIEGIQCTEFTMFQQNTGSKYVTNGTSDACSGLDIRSSTGWNGYNVIGLINRTTTTANTLNGSDTATTTKIGGSRASSNAGLILTATANEGGPQRSTSIIAGTTTATYNQVIITSPVYSFTNLAAAGTKITGVFLMNNTSSTSTLDLGFAENSFTGLSLTNTDTLTATWTISFT